MLNHASSVGSFGATPFGAPSFATGPTPNLLGLAHHPGSGEDFELTTGINQAATQNFIAQFATTGDLLYISLDSPLGGYALTPPVLYAQLFPQGIRPFAPVDYPEVYLDFAPGVYYQILTLYSGLASPFSTGLLPPGGLNFAYPIPAGLAGMGLMIQGFAVAPSMMTGNTWFTATDAKEIFFY